MLRNDPPLAREEFPVTGHWAYLNHAGMGAVPRSAVQAMSRLAMEVARDGELAWPEHKAHVEQVRHRAARLMGVPGTDVAFIKNTTSGLGMVANGLDLSAGDRVVASDLDFPSSLYPDSSEPKRERRVAPQRPSKPPTEGSGEPHFGAAGGSRRIADTTGSAVAFDRATATLSRPPPTPRHQLDRQPVDLC